MARQRRSNDHGGTYRGRKVLLVLRDGRRIADRFIEGRSRHIVLAIAGKVQRSAILSFRLCSIVPR